MKDSPAEIDWDRLIALAESRKLVVLIRNTLTYLSETLSAPVPEVVLGRLMSIPTPRWEISEHALKIRTVTPLRRAQFHWVRHQRQSGTAGFPSRVLTLPGYFQHSYALEHLWQVPLVAPTRFASSIGRWLLRRSH
jgi:hypothetical protein